MFELIEALRIWTQNIVLQFGYPGIVFAIFAENIFPPLPSEVIMALAGFLVAEGRFNFWLVSAAATLGAVLAAVVFYYVGLYGGRPLIKKYGKYLKITEEDLAYTDKWFFKYGDYVIFFGRFIPIIRTLVSFPAGITKVNFAKFLIYTTIGSFLWLTMLTYVGTKLGENWASISQFFEKYEHATMLILGLGAVFFIYRYYHKKMKKEKAA